MYGLRTFFMAAVLSTAALVPTVAQAGNAGQEPCIFREHKILSVAPYKDRGPTPTAAMDRMSCAALRSTFKPSPGSRRSGCS